MFLGLVFISCSQQLSNKDRIYKVTDIFLKYIKEGNEQQVYDMAYHVDYPNNITSPNKRKDMVEKVSDLINKFGLPSHDKWIFKRTALDYEVHIPISNYNDTNTVLKNVEIIISFPPPKVSNKIFDFDFDGDLDTSKLKPVMAPFSQ